MEFFIGDMTAGVFYGIIGVKMCGLASRTGEMPERMLAVCFLGWSAAYLTFLPFFQHSDGSWPVALSICSTLVDAIAYVACGLFTLAVFRRQEVWARWLIAMAVACLIGGVSGSFWVGDVEVNSPLNNPFYWLYSGGGVALFGWLAGETFTAYAGARRRWKLGLCTRMVCNRYLLLGLAATLWVTVAVLAASDFIVFALTESWFPPINYLLGVAEFASIVMVWLAFIPPTFYQNWIESAEKRLDGAEL